MPFRKKGYCRQVSGRCSYILQTNTSPCFCKNKHFPLCCLRVSCWCGWKGSSARKSFLFFPVFSSRRMSSSETFTIGRQHSPHFTQEKVSSRKNSSAEGGKVIIIFSAGKRLRPATPPVFLQGRRRHLPGQGVQPLPVLPEKG